MIDIENYILQLTERLKAQFGPRLTYVGLQGSYLRGEAHDGSDIDIMAVIDGLNVDDLDAYRAILDGMEHRDRSCGFLCGREDLALWNPLEICHVLHSTKDCYGVLAELVPAYTKEDVRGFIKLSVNNLYHELVHRYVHADPEKSVRQLPGTCKGVFFILQDLCWLRHGEFPATKGQLLQQLAGKDREVLARAMDMSAGKVFDFRESFELLLTWCRESLRSV